MTTTTVDPGLFDKLRSELTSEFVNRDTELDAIILALVSRSHLFMLSQPGEGKTALMNRLIARITGMQGFSTVLDRFADDTALFGPLDIDGLRQSPSRRIRSAGPWMQRAHIALLDEIWKASSSLAQTLLPVLEERKYFEDGHMVDTPTSTVLMTSNELPSSGHDELAAVWDRVHLRLVVDEILDPADMALLLNLDWDPDPQPLLDWADIERAQAAARLVPVTKETNEALIDIVVGIRREGIRVSSRRLRRAQDMVRVAAWLDGQEETNPGHLDFLRHMLWDTPEQRGTVEKAVYDVAEPSMSDVIDLMDTVATLHQDLAEYLTLEGSDPKRIAGSNELYTKAKRAAYALVEVEKRATSPRSRPKLEDAERRIEHIAVTTLVELMGFEEAQCIPLLPQARNGTLKMV